jgi:hypothetical protein
MEKVTQFSIALENVPGQLGRLCRVMFQGDVNIRAISISDAADVSVIRVIASNAKAAKKALREAGLPFVTQEVVVVELADQPGALEHVAVRLGEADINLQYVYGSTDTGSRKAILVLGVTDVDRALQALAD